MGGRAHASAGPGNGLMFEIVLVAPEIPPNTGNVIRLCANTGAALHLVEPLGFRMSDRELRRAGLDSHEYAAVQIHADSAACQRALADVPGRQWFAFTAHATSSLHDARFAGNDVLVFGRETAGLGPELLAQFPERQR